MAKSFYKYVEREADSFVNWAEIGKGMSDMLIETNRVREEKKAAIDQASRDFQNKLNNVPTGQDASARKEALTYADNASKFMLMQDRLLKSGKMSLKEYTIGRQNILDDTDRIFSSMNKYQTQYAERMKRYKDGVSSIGELKSMEKVEGFGNWEKSGAYINPETGRVVMAMKEEKVVDGKKVYTMSTNPNQFASISHLDGLMDEYWDKFDVAKVTDEWSSKLGKEMTSLSIKAASLVSQGQIRTTDDITKRKDLSEDEKTVLFDFFDAETKYINSSLINPFDRASTLLDYVGKASNGESYFFTQDKNVANSNAAAILEVIDPVTQASTFDFNAEQIKESQEYVRKIARSKYNRTDEIQSTSQLTDQTYRPPAPTSAEYAQRDEDKEADVLGQNIVWAFSGKTPQEVQNGLAYLGALGVKLNKGTDTAVIQTPNGAVTLDLAGDPLNVMISAIGGSNPQGINADKIKRSIIKYGSGRKLDRVTDAVSVTPPPAPPAPKPTVSIPKDVFTVASQKAVINLRKFLPPGFTAEDKGGWSGNIIHVYAPGESAAKGNEPYIFNTKLPSSTVASVKQGLDEFIKKAQDAEL